MNKIRTIRNKDVNKILVGVPEGHKHLRIPMKLKDARASYGPYTTVKSHPSIRAQELETRTSRANLRKAGNAVHHLLETPRNNEEVEKELKELLEKGELSIQVISQLLSL